MKLNHKLFDKMRDVTRSLMSGGARIATIDIQNVLRGAGKMDKPMHDAWKQPAPQRPESVFAKQAQPASDTASDATSRKAADPMAGFVPDLLAKLRILTPGERTPFSVPPFSTPYQPGAPASEESSTPAGARFITASFTNQAGTRQYKVYIPSSYRNKPMPLVVMLHGCTQNPDDFAIGTKMNALAEEHHCLVAYPAQTQTANSSKCWNWFSAIDQKRDQGEPSIIAGITREIIAEYAVDPRRVYIAGLSAGGAMAAIMHATYPDLYAAAGVHSGLAFGSAHDLPSALGAMKGAGMPAFGKPMEAAVPHAKVIPIIVFHGDRDKTVHPRNGDEIMTQSLSRFNGSSGKPDVIVQEGQAVNGQLYTCTMHRNAGGQIIAEQWLIHGAGHAWSGGSKGGSYTDPSGPDATQEMMRFFYSHSLPH